MGSVFCHQHCWGDNNDSSSSQSQASSIAGSSQTGRKSKFIFFWHGEDDTQERPLLPESSNHSSLNGLLNGNTTSSPSISIPSTHANLYRDETDTLWDLADIENLRTDMSIQLDALKTESVRSAMKTPGVATPGSCMSELEGIIAANVAAGIAWDQRVKTPMTPITPRGILKEDIRESPQPYVSIHSLFMNENDPNHEEVNSMNTMNELNIEDNAFGQIPPPEPLNIRHCSKGSNLVQEEGCDWDLDELQEEASHIKKQIHHLQQTSGSLSLSGNFV